MQGNGNQMLIQVLSERQSELLAEWMAALTTGSIRRDDLMKEAELRGQCGDFLRMLRDAVQSGNVTNVMAPEWADVRELLSSISRSRTLQGFSPREVATFVFSLKKPLFNQLHHALENDTRQLFDELATASDLLDNLGLWTTEAYQKVREEVIRRQQEELLELSTPVVKLWDGVLALPIIGTLDSSRTQTVMEALLQKIVDTGSEVAIIDITGVPTVDTLTAQHLLKTVTAARLMGADCIISGIRPQIAQTIVHLGVELGDVVTKATLADAFVLALRRTGASVVRTAGRPGSEK